MTHPQPIATISTPALFFFQRIIDWLDICTWVKQKKKKKKKYKQRENNTQDDFF
jgi:hypothetical protein